MQDFRAARHCEHNVHTNKEHVHKTCSRATLGRLCYLSRAEKEQHETNNINVLKLGNQHGPNG